MPLKLLLIIAHPDDECFAFGGALALAADHGIETSVLCFTSGTAGSYRGSATTNEELGQLRRAEFAASCKILGVAHTEVLHYQDGQLDQQPLTTLASDIVSRIRTFRPDIVLTFGGDGALNTHPDHTVISAATTAAFHWSGHPKRYPDLGPLFQPQRLYYVTTSYFLPDRHMPYPAPWSVTVNINSVFDRKLAAFAAHTTQAPLMKQVEPIFDQHGRDEHYTLIAASIPQPTHQSTDLFDGLK